MTATEQIDQLIAGLDDWRGKTFAAVRKAILAADRGITEAWKWMGSPVWESDGNLIVGNAHKDKVKLTFSHGASLPDPHGLFNNGFGGKVWRAIDLHEGDKINVPALKELVRAAVAFNQAKARKAAMPKGVPAKTATEAKPKSAAKSAAKPTKSSAPKADKTAGKTGMSKPRPPLKPNKDGVILLSGGNPQIPKGDGDAPVQAYIAAMPGWKSALGKQLDVLIERTVPHLAKAVKWNSPFYGVEGQGWFLNFHVFDRYLKVTFFKGKSLNPMPPGGTPKSGEARWIDIYEDDGLDEAQMTEWLKQAAAIPGWLA